MYGLFEKKCSNEQRGNQVAAMINCLFSYAVSLGVVLIFTHKDKPRKPMLFPFWRRFIAISDLVHPQDSDNNSS